MLAFADDSIQLCYATAHQYNETGYSVPGNYCYYLPDLRL
jgi:hypothetical protein